MMNMALKGLKSCMCFFAVLLFDPWTRKPSSVCSIKIDPRTVVEAFSKKFLGSSDVLGLISRSKIS